MKCKLNTKKIKSSLAKLIVENMEFREKRRVNNKGEETLPPLFDYPGFKAAILLDPRFKSILSKEDIEAAKTFLKVVWKKLQALKEEEEEEEGGGGGGAALLANRSLQLNRAGEGSDDEEDDEFAAFMKAKNNERFESETSWDTKIENLINTYERTTKSLPLKADVLQFWETQRMIQPELYLLATTVLAIPSAQVSVERLFSSLGFILNPLRFNLGSERIDDILILHGNDDVTKRTPVVETEMEVRSSSATSAASHTSSSDN